MKTILVPVGGGDADAAVLETARTVARVSAAHVRFLHVRVGAADAALHVPHVSYAIGAGARSALQMLNKEGARRAAVAARNVAEFCAAWGIANAEIPGSSQAPTAQWLNEDGDFMQRLLFHARASDLVIMGRPTKADGMPKDRLERMLLQSGRPLLVVPSNRPLRSLGAVLVCWNETVEATRAVSAALPLLMAAERVTVVCVAEKGVRSGEALRELVAYLAWHGIAAQSEALARGQAIENVLRSAARACSADLMVMGGYSHAHVRQVLFGGYTQAVLESAELPVLLMH